jgi:hypothetical protein
LGRLGRFQLGVGPLLAGLPVRLHVPAEFLTRLDLLTHLIGFLRIEPAVTCTPMSLGALRPPPRAA